MPRTKHVPQQNWELLSTTAWIWIFGSILVCLTLYVFYKVYKKKLGLQATLYLCTAIMLVWLCAVSKAPTPLWILPFFFICITIGNAVWNETTPRN